MLDLFKKKEVEITLDDVLELQSRTGKEVIILFAKLESINAQLVNYNNLDMTVKNNVKLLQLANEKKRHIQDLIKENNILYVLMRNDYILCRVGKYVTNIANKGNQIVATELADYIQQLRTETSIEYWIKPTKKDV